MYKAERAIILAAGMGRRMQPITLTTPKPLVKVKGVRMIDTVISALHDNGITEIYVVVGYLKEQFMSLESEYPGLKIVENPYYKRCNNISSLYVAREYINNTIILDGDQIIYNKDIIKQYYERSCYNAVYTESPTDEWLMNVDGGIVKSCSRSGGDRGWQLYSVSFWSKEDGEKLKKHLEMEFEQNKNYQIYWDDVVMFCYPREYELGVREMKKGDVVEIDNIAELIAIDSHYLQYLEGVPNES